MMTAHETYLGTRVFGCLDGLRALSIVAVVWHHACPPNSWPATGRGFLGVDLFFVISGFLIVTLLLRERDRRGRISLSAFYMRRSLRIVPLNYFVILAVWAGTSISGGSQAEAVRRDVPYALTYLANWFPMHSLLAITWSLAAEEQFYVVWPLVERCSQSVVRWAWWGLVGTSIVLSCGHAHVGVFVGVPRMLAETTFVPILFGVGLAHALHSPVWFRRITLLAGGRHSAPVLLFLLLAAVSIPLDDISGLPRLALHGLLTLLVAACVVREDNGLRAVLRNWVFVRIGVVSYGIYLLHQVGLHVVEVATKHFAWWGSGMDFVSCLIVTWGMAEVSYQTFERYFLRWKGQWRR